MSAGDSHSNHEPLVRLVDVHKRFGDLIVLDGIDLTLRTGETTVVIGESGVGNLSRLRPALDAAPLGEHRSGGALRREGGPDPGKSSFPFNGFHQCGLFATYEGSRTLIYR